MFRRKRSPKPHSDDRILKAPEPGPGEQPRVIVMPDGTTACQDHNGITVRQPDGSEHVIDAEGHSVTIADIAYVTAHHVNRIHETVSHVVKFVNGGTLCYAVDMNGRLLDCEFSRLQVSVTDGHVVAGCTEVALSLKPGTGD